MGGTGANGEKKRDGGEKRKVWQGALGLGGKRNEFVNWIGR